MKNALFILSLSIISCKGKIESGTVVTTGTDQNLSNEINGSEVRILVTESNSYCGGAHPTDEMYREITAPHVIPGKLIFIKRDENGNSDSPVLYTLSADDSGYVNIKLPAGAYVIVDEKKRDRAHFNQLLTAYRVASEFRTAIDSVCLEGWYKIPALSFVVEERNDLNLSVNFHNPCPWSSVPCSHYNGPLPP